jgi:GTP-binding protein
MPQTRFVTQKALEHGFRPIIVINKIDRDGARPDWVLDRTFDLIDRLEANDNQLDFPVVYTSALNGSSGLSPQTLKNNMDALFETIISQISPPDVDEEGPFQMQISTLDYNTYQGVIGIGRIARGKIRTNTPVSILDHRSQSRSGRILQIFRLLGLERIEIREACAGDIVAITGVDELNISETLCDPEYKQALPALSVDEPTVSMTFQVNDSPLCGREGRYVTSRHIYSRLQRELKHNVALHVEETGDPDKFIVSGRGELHLSILIENMRREGYEMGVSRPDVVRKKIDGHLQEPYEQLTVDMDERYQGAVMELLGQRGGDFMDMSPDGNGRVRLDYSIPARGIIGIRTDFLTATSGTGLFYHVFDHYGPVCRTISSNRSNGALISKNNGKSLAYALFNLQERGQLLIGPGSEVYEGRIVGIHSRRNDLVVNPLKAKQLTNVRAAGKDDHIVLTPPLTLTLEQALGFINDDELVEITPVNIRIRKKLLKEHERKRAARASEELTC